MSEEGGKNYAPAYYFHIHSLFPAAIVQTLTDTAVFYPYNEDISLYSKNLYATIDQSLCFWIVGFAKVPFIFELHGRCKGKAT
jgi:hypothetical protein